MSDAADKILEALRGQELDQLELAVDAGLTTGAVQNGLRTLLREGKVTSQVDNGVKLWRLTHG